jgi:hypothetical protein
MRWKITKIFKILLQDYKINPKRLHVWEGLMTLKFTI